jgi:hypothetical protein
MIAAALRTMLIIIYTNLFSMTHSPPVAPDRAPPCPAPYVAELAEWPRSPARGLSARPPKGPRLEDLALGARPVDLGALPCPRGLAARISPPAFCAGASADDVAPRAAVGEPSGRASRSAPGARDLAQGARRTAPRRLDPLDIPCDLTSSAASACRPAASCLYSSAAEHALRKRMVVGSIPTGGLVLSR